LDLTRSSMEVLGFGASSSIDIQCSLVSCQGDRAILTSSPTHPQHREIL
jgi:hypothetical protein